MLLEKKAGEVVFVQEFFFFKSLKRINLSNCLKAQAGLELISTIAQT